MYAKSLRDYLLLCKPLVVVLCHGYRVQDAFFDRRKEFFWSGAIPGGVGETKKGTTSLLTDNGYMGQVSTYFRPVRNQIRANVFCPFGGPNKADPSLERNKGNIFTTPYFKMR